MPQLPHEKFGGLIAAKFDGLTLLLHQSQVSAIEQIENSAGYGGTIHTLSGTLSPVGAARPLYVIAHHDAGDLGLACEEVNVMPRSTTALCALPEVMRSEGSPFTAYARLQEGLGFLCSVRALAGLLGKLECPGHGC